MKIVSDTLNIKTGGNGDLINITDNLIHIVNESKLKQGNLTAFVVGSTAALTTFEFESGMIQDVKDMFEKLITSSKHYNHDETWGDANGFSHLRASLQGQSITIPFDGGSLALGTWQQVVLAEFDVRPRQRRIVVQLIGE